LGTSDLLFPVKKLLAIKNLVDFFVGEGGVNQNKNTKSYSSREDALKIFF
jgi:hypothetical protein